MKVKFIFTRSFQIITVMTLGLALSTTGVVSAADMSNGADNFY